MDLQSEIPRNGAWNPKSEERRRLAAAKSVDLPNSCLLVPKKREPDLSV